MVFQGSNVSTLEGLFMSNKGYRETGRRRYPGAPPLTLVRYVPQAAAETPAG